MDPVIIHLDHSGPDPVDEDQFEAELALKQDTAEKEQVNGYAGLNASSRAICGIDAVSDLIVDHVTKGLVLKDSNAHYWRLSVSTLGIITTADLGTTKP